MDNLGDWLYIVLLVIAGISGLLGAGKKKKQPTEELDEPGNVSDPDYWPQEVVIPPLQPVKTEKKRKTQKKQSGYISLFTEGERSIATSSIPDLYSTQPEDAFGESRPGVSGDTFQDADELKKAIIYSEILNRKY
ncbi:MAG: hypothetical protein LBQ73_04090 [Tannerellaceae bacterium]|jgi:hypothetical protein|nr:hypothetical protein [Tannerellaceae bacterium]